MLDWETLWVICFDAIRYRVELTRRKDGRFTSTVVVGLWIAYCCMKHKLNRHRKWIPVERTEQQREGSSMLAWFCNNFLVYNRDEPWTGTGSDQIRQRAQTRRERDDPIVVYYLNISNKHSVVYSWPIAMGTERNKRAEQRCSPHYCVKRGNVRVL